MRLGWQEDELSRRAKSDPCKLALGCLGIAAWALMLRYSIQNPKIEKVESLPSLLTSGS